MGLGERAGGLGVEVREGGDGGKEESRAAGMATRLEAERESQAPTWERA